MSFGLSIVGARLLDTDTTNVLVNVALSCSVARLLSSPPSVTVTAISLLPAMLLAGARTKVPADSGES